MNPTTSSVYVGDEPLKLTTFEKYGRDPLVRIGNVCLMFQSLEHAEARARELLAAIALLREQRASEVVVLDAAAAIQGEV